MLPTVGGRSYSTDFLVRRLRAYVSGWKGTRSPRPPRPPPAPRPLCPRRRRMVRPRRSLPQGPSSSPTTTDICPRNPPRLHPQGSRRTTASSPPTRRQPSPSLASLMCFPEQAPPLLPPQAAHPPPPLPFPHHTTTPYLVPPGLTGPMVRDPRTQYSPPTPTPAASSQRTCCLTHQPLLQDLHGITDLTCPSPPVGLVRAPVLSPLNGIAPTWVLQEAGLGLTGRLPACRGRQDWSRLCRSS